jgi:8-amino-7-oxononanoate synthase
MPNIPTDSCDATTITRGDRSYLSFGGCNYLGLAHRPEVVRAVQQAAETFGLSTSASRETTGNARPHAVLETELTQFCGHASGLLVPDGYTANLAALQGLEHIGIGHALVDARAHASLKDAAKLAGMQIHIFEHLDVSHAINLIHSLPSPCVVLTDSVFTTDGEVAPARSLVGLLRSDDWLLLDDCHGFCVMGEQGRGMPNAIRLRSERLIVTTTLAKGLGCAGGIVMGPSEPVESSRQHSIAYRCTTPASPALVAGGLIALNILQNERAVHDRLKASIACMRETLHANGIHVHHHDTAIFAFTIGDVEIMRLIEQAMYKRGVIMPLMDYPNGPAPIYFRLSVNASHSREQIERFGDILDEVLIETQQRESVKHEHTTGSP